MYYANPYGPTQRALENISSRIERSADRKAQHAGRMSELALSGERLSMERGRMGMEQERLGLQQEQAGRQAETHGLDVRIKGAQARETERLEATEQERLTELNSISKLNSLDTYEEVLGPDPEGKKFGLLKNIVPSQHHIYTGTGKNKKLIGFNVPRGAVPNVKQKLAQIAHPYDLIQQKVDLDNAIKSLTAARARKDGTSKYDEDLRNAISDREYVNELAEWSVKNPIKSVVRRYIASKGKGMEADEVSLAKRYIEADIAKKKAKETGQLTESQKREAFKKVKDELEDIFFDDDGNPVNPSSQQIENAQRYAAGYGYYADITGDPGEKKKFWFDKPSSLDYVIHPLADGAGPSAPKALPEGLTEADIEFNKKKYGKSREESIERFNEMNR